MLPVPPGLGWTALGWVGLGWALTWARVDAQVTAPQVRALTYLVKRLLGDGVDGLGEAGDGGGGDASHGDAAVARHVDVVVHAELVHLLARLGIEKNPYGYITIVILIIWLFPPVILFDA